ncbi:TonB family protein [Adhaeribacter swui]|uniref:TonB family protein n=1 Tax=Adhaeribacter swui TaxID=2086471 RepID=A0A7G7G5V8_9BACT|nr:TonB family protein [Adhaeribacter swui]QNF32542.1 TonB family protein [Adhaeribacter swui]
MKQVAFLVFFFSNWLSLTAQQINPERVFNATEVEVQPRYGKLPESIYQFLGSNIRYPVTASLNGVSGTVILSFIIRKDGKMDSLGVASNPGYGLDQEALRVIKMSANNWKPALIKNEAVACRVYFPVRFASQNNNQISTPSLSPPAQPRVDKATRKLIEQAEQANVHYNQGLDKYEQDKLEEAIAAFDKALNIKPDHIPALQNRGIVKYKLKDVAGACADWQRIVNLGQSLPEALVNACK